MIVLSLLLLAGCDPARTAPEGGADTGAGLLPDASDSAPNPGAVDPASLVGGTWSMDLSQATWVQPAGGGALFGQLFEGLLALGVRDASRNTLSVIGGGLLEIEPGVLQQDPCIPTFELDDVPFDDNPAFEAGPARLELTVQGVPVPIDAVVISGRFSEDASQLQDASLQAEVDARDLEDTVGMSAAELCDLLTVYIGLECIACSTDGEQACVGLIVEDIIGERVEGLAMQRNPDAQECAGG